MDAVKKSSREEKQRDAKVEEQVEKIVRSLGNNNNDNQKIQSLARTILEMEREQLKQAAVLKQMEKYFESVQREKENLQKEHNKGVLVRDKLEQVCREQQKLMKTIKSESMSRIREEEEKRKETQAKFQQSISEIISTLGKNNDENLKLKEANLEMTKKFKHLAEQYEIREKQLEKINDQINLESQLNEAKLAKAKMESTIEREILLKEKEAGLESLLISRKTILDMQGREQVLKEQLNLYTGKYQDFQTSLQKSNDIFVTYKHEIEKMSKRIKMLEKEASEWRIKYEKSNRAILEMATDKQQQDRYVGKTSRQIAQLQKLCRQLQADRTQLKEVLKENSIECPAMVELPPEPTDIEQPPKGVDKLELMSQNCSELKKSLALLQGQMNAFTNNGGGNNGNGATTESTETNSKSNTSQKNKKNNKKNKSKTKDIVLPVKEEINGNKLESLVDNNLPTNSETGELLSSEPSIIENTKDDGNKKIENETNKTNGHTEVIGVTGKANGGTGFIEVTGDIGDIGTSSTQDKIVDYLVDPVKSIALDEVAGNEVDTDAAVDAVTSSTSDINETPVADLVSVD